MRYIKFYPDPIRIHLVVKNALFIFFQIELLCRRDRSESRRTRLVKRKRWHFILLFLKRSAVDLRPEGRREEKTRNLRGVSLWPRRSAENKRDRKKNHRPSCRHGGFVKLDRGLKIGLDWMSPSSFSRVEEGGRKTFCRKWVISFHALKGFHDIVPSSEEGCVHL